MSTKEERFAIFKKQTAELLTEDEAKEVKQTLATFLKEKDLSAMIFKLNDTLNSEEKQQLFPTIKSLIPAAYHDEFDTLLASLTEVLEVSEQISSTRKHRLVGNDEDDDEDEEFVPSGGGDEEESMFDLMIAMAEADLKIGDDGETVILGDQDADTRRKIMRKSMKLKQKGFKFQDFVPGAKPTDKPQQSVSQAGPQDEDEEIEIPDCICSFAKSRQEAEQILQESGLRPGLFLLRKKDVGNMGKSFKRKPGQKTAKEAWALSIVLPNRTATHLLIERYEIGGELYVGGQEYGHKTTLLELLSLMHNSGSYRLETTPFQCRRWYHHEITRDEAEERLLKVPVDGRFLVRKSLREENTYVVSVLFDGKTLHNKVHAKDGAFIASAAPLVKHETLQDLIEHHQRGANGMQTQLTSPCAAPDFETIV